MKATDLLRQQHREVEELFRQMQSAEDEEERGALREELANALAAHTSIEEEIFYPAAMEAIGPAGRVREALEEHAIADFALYRFTNVSTTDETFAAKLGALKDVVMDHVEEEESELLPQAEGEMPREQLEMLGERLASRFEERLAEGYQAILARSLGIAARQVAQTAPGAKKASAPRRAPAKQKGNGGTTKTTAQQPAKRGQTETAARKARAQKTTPARGQGVSRKNPTRTVTSARGGQTTQKGMGHSSRTQAGGGARKQRAGR